MKSLASLPSIEIGAHCISLAQILRYFHQHGRLLPLLRETVVAELCRAEAERLGLTISDDELQQAADRFRRRQELDSAKKTNAWLAGQRLSVQDLEAALERDLLTKKLREHVTKEAIPDHFERHQSAFDRVKLQQIVVAREDLAAELRSQVKEEGKDFIELARQHASQEKGSEAIEAFRRQLPREVAEAVFAAKPGEIVGPLPTPQGFLLALVEEIQPAELDAATAAAIQQELFGMWLDEKLKEANISFPLLDAL